MATLEAEADKREQYSRRPNLRFHGIEEKEGEDTNAIVIDVVQKKLYFLIYPRHLTLLIMMFCYINYVIMELQASVINGSPVTSLIVNSTLK